MKKEKKVKQSDKSIFYRVVRFGICCSKCQRKEVSAETYAGVFVDSLMLKGWQIENNKPICFSCVEKLLKKA